MDKRSKRKETSPNFLHLPVSAELSDHMTSSKMQPCLSEFEDCADAVEPTRPATQRERTT